MNTPEYWTLDEARQLAREVLTIFPGRCDQQARTPQNTNGAA